MREEVRVPNAMSLARSPRTRCARSAIASVRANTYMRAPLTKSGSHASPVAVHEGCQIGCTELYGGDSAEAENAGRSTGLYKSAVFTMPAEPEKQRAASGVEGDRKEDQVTPLAGCPDRGSVAGYALSRERDKIKPASYRQ